MGCVKTTKKVIKNVWREISGDLVTYAVSVILMFDDLKLSNEEKREAVVKLIQLRDDVTERLARLVLEFALNAVRMDDVDDGELGVDDGAAEDAAIAGAL